jgi:hypothetical protein
MERSQSRRERFLAVGSLAATNAVFPAEAQRQLGDMVEQIARSDRNLQGIIGTEQSVPIKAGFAAEEVHAHSFNMQAMLERRMLRSYTDRYDEWASLGLRRNDSSADIVTRNLESGESVNTQVKYFKSAQDSANAMREMRDGAHHYRDADRFIGPSDQVAPDDGGMSIQDYARRAELKNQLTRPEVSEAAGHVRESVSDRLCMDGVESREVSYQEAQQVASGDYTLREAQNTEFLSNATFNNTVMAAGSAAVAAALIATVITSAKCCTALQKGEMTEGQVVLAIVRCTSTAAVDAALKASGAATAVAATTRYGLLPVMAQQSIGALLTRNIIVGSAICGVDLIQCLVRVASGKMTMAQLEERTGKNVFQTSAGVWGSAIGMHFAGGSALALAPLLGAYIGGLVSVTAMTVAVNRGIEHPYKRLVESNLALVLAQRVMTDTAIAFHEGQSAFEAFLCEEAALVQRFDANQTQISKDRQQVWDAIERLREENT